MELVKERTAPLSNKVYEDLLIKIGNNNYFRQLLDSCLIKNAVLSQLGNTLRKITDNPVHHCIFQVMVDMIDEGDRLTDPYKVSCFLSYPTLCELVKMHLYSQISNKDFVLKNEHILKAIIDLEKWMLISIKHKDSENMLILFSSFEQKTLTEVSYKLHNRDKGNRKVINFKKEQKLKEQQSNAK